MQTTNQRKRVILLAVAFLAVGVLAASAEAKPSKSPRRAARTQNRDHNRGHPSVAQPQRKSPARVAQPQHKGRDEGKGGVTISFNLGGHAQTEWARPKAAVCPRGHYETRFVPPLYETRYDRCGRMYEMLIRDGYWEQVWIPHRCSAGCHDRRPDTGITIQGHFNF